MIAAFYQYLSDLSRCVLGHLAVVNSHIKHCAIPKVNSPCYNGIFQNTTVLLMVG